MDPVVSFDDELLTLVDPQDNVVGYAPKDASHDGEGRLHRAFSVFLLNDRGEVLLQQRSAQKRLWPLYWSNSCCSHPRQGEDVLAAGERRIFEELTLRAELRFVYKFEYHARFGAAGSEHELCYVYVGRVHGELKANANEIAAWRYVPVAELDREVARDASRFTPWFKLEWEALRRDHASVLDLARW